MWRAGEERVARVTCGVSFDFSPLLAIDPASTRMGWAFFGLGGTSDDVDW